MKNIHLKFFYHTLSCVLLFALFFTTTNASAQCSSIYVKVDTNVSCSPGIFIFSIVNAPASALFRWDFGKGYVQGTDTFKIIQIDPAVINLKIRVDFVGGDSCVKQYKKIASVIANPVPKMSISKSTFCSTNESFVLTDQTVGSNFRIWLIEGNSINVKSKQYTSKFTSQGKKNIVLIVEDSFGCRSVKTFDNIAEVIDNHSFSISSTESKICEGVPTTYTLNTSLAGGDFSSIKWSFPGGTPASSNQFSPPNVTYKDGGKYGISLELTTTKGCIYKLQQPNIIEIVKPRTLNVSISDSILCLLGFVDIEIKNTGLYGSIEWNAGGAHLYDSFTRQLRKYYYEAPGLFDLQITYKDSFCTSIYTKKNYISAKRVYATLHSTDHYDCVVPLLTKFTNHSYASVPGKLSYKWSIYDSKGKVVDTSSSKDYSYKVTEPGLYDVELFVTHENGCTDIAYHTELIRADSIRIDFSPTPKFACLNQDVVFLNQSYPSSHQVEDQFFWWLYVDGNPDPIDSSDTKQPIFKAGISGIYHVKVKAWNSLGCTQELYRKDAMEVVIPRADFSVIYDTVCTDQMIALKSQNYPDKGDFSQTWRISNSTDTFFYHEISDVSDSIVVPGVYDIRYNISIYGECKDTATKLKSLVISAIEAEIKLPTTATCRNADFKPTAKIDNFVYGKTSKKVSYTWSATPNIGVKVIDRNTSNPIFNFSKNGQYILRLIVKNEISCRDTTFSDTVYVGLDPEFTLSDTSVCANTNVVITNKTVGFANKFIYSSTPTQPLNFKDLGDGSGVINISQNGDYQIHLVAGKDSVCFDTFSTNLHVVLPKASFTTLDSNLYCAPVYQRFRSTSTNTDTMFWDFGDGKTLTSTDTRVTTVYQQNTGSLNPYTVQLIAKHHTGCADTLTMKDLVTVSGPAVNFKLTNNRGCEPLKVNLVGKTENVAKMFVDYGDGGDFGYEINVPHAYKNSWRIIEQEYRPQVLVVDKYGCVNAVKSDSSVFVKPSPHAHMGLLDTIGCAPITTTYYYLGQNAKSWYWDFDGNGTADGSNAAGKHVYNVPGEYQLTLVNINSFNCTDTARSKVKSAAAPKVNIGLDSVICISKLLTVKDLTTYDLKGKTRNWKITSPNHNFTSTDSIYNFVATNSENVIIQLDIVDESGCSGTERKTIKIRDSTNSQPAVLNSVSVSTNQLVDVNYQAPSSGYLISGVKRLNGVMYDEISSQNISKTSYLDSFGNATNQSACYQIQHADTCGFLGKPSNNHCTIFLQTTAVDEGIIDLNWTPYVGWTQVSAYNVYRQTPNAFEWIGSVDGSTFGYKDSGRCAMEYCYFVEAISSNPSVSSKSNISCNTAIYSGNTSLTHIDNVTVINDDYIELKIDNQSKASSFYLFKKVGNAPAQQILTNNKTHNDFDADVHQQSYSYAVKGIDHCGEPGETGRFGKSIFFEVSYSDKIYFNWTPYQEWADGVDNYTIMRNEKGNYVPLLKVSSSDTSAIVDFSAELSASNCFRVEASNVTKTQLSTSNIACVESAPTVFIPTAFVPESSHGNNDFKPFVRFIKSPLDYSDGVYDLQIFNSWGQKVFQTNDPGKGWDGTFGETDCPMGSYLYTFRVRGLDDQFVNLTGSVILIR